MCNVSKMFAKLFSRKKIKANRAVIVPQSTESKEDLKLDILINFESILKTKKQEALIALANLVDNAGLYNEDDDTEEKFRNVTKTIGLDFESYDVDDLAAFFSGVEWISFCDDVYVKNYDVAFSKLIYLYAQFCEGNYTFYPNVDTIEDLVYVISPIILNRYFIPEYLEDYIDWNSFVEDWVENNNGKFARYGYFEMGEVDW